MNKTLTLLFTTSILNYVHANNIPETPALTNQLMGAYQTQYNDFNDDDSANFAEEDSSSIADNHMPEETQPQGTISLPNKSHLWTGRMPGYMSSPYIYFQNKHLAFSSLLFFPFGENKLLPFLKLSGVSCYEILCLLFAFLRCASDIQIS